MPFTTGTEPDKAGKKIRKRNNGAQGLYSNLLEMW